MLPSRSGAASGTQMARVTLGISTVPFWLHPRP